MHIHFVAAENETNVPVNVLVNVSVNLTEKNVLEIIKNNVHITQNDIATATQRDKKTVQRAINKLKKLGLIERIGSDKTGHWKIIEL